VTEPRAPAWRSRVLLALVALVLAAAVVLGVVLLSERNRVPVAEPTPSPSVTAEHDDGDGGAQPGPEVPDDGAGGPPELAPRALGDLLVAAAGPFVSGDLGAAPPPLDEGVVAAYGGTFTNGRDVVTLRALELGSPEAATAAAAAPAPVGFGAEDARDAGDVGDPVVGTYVTYQRDAAGAIRWTNGPYLLELEGPWDQVRELYLAYPL
jgi:hypothetical protein